MADIKCIVTTVDAKGNSKKFELTQSHFYIGRADNCDISLPVKGISRQHVEVTIRQGQIYVKDLNSSNGTRINGTNLPGGIETQVMFGDELWLGPMESAITFAIPVGNETEKPAALPMNVQATPVAPLATAIPTIISTHAPLVTPPQMAPPPTPTMSAPPVPGSLSPAVPAWATPPAQTWATPPAQTWAAPPAQTWAPPTATPPPIPFTPRAATPAAPPFPRAGSSFPYPTDTSSGLFNGGAALAQNTESSVIRDLSVRELDPRIKQVQEQAGYILQEAKIKADNLMSQAKLAAREEVVRVEQNAHRMFAEAEDHANEVRKTAELEAEQIRQLTHKKSLAIIEEANQNAIQLQSKVRAEVALLKRESERQAETLTSAAREQARELRGKIQTEYDEVLSSVRKKAEEDYQKLIGTAKDEAILIKTKNESLYKENKILEEKRQDLENKAQAVAQALLVREKDLRDITGQYDEKKKNTVEFETNFNQAKVDHQALLKQMVDAKLELEKLARQINEFETKKNDYESFADKELASARAHQKEELQKRRDQILVDHEKLKLDLEKELVEARRREMEKIQGLRQEEIKLIKERRHIQTAELARAIEMFLRPVMSEALGAIPTPEALRGLDRTLEPLIRRVLGGEDHERSGSKAEQILTASADERRKKRWQHFRRALVCVAFLGMILVGFFKPIWLSEFAKRIAGDEQRNEYFKPKNRVRYAPAQDDIYRNSYTENLLYLKEYAKYKADPEARKHWILSLNNLFIQDLGLNENLAVNFVGQESAMADTLMQELEMIDPAFLKLGLDRMNRSEVDSLQNIRKIVVKDQDWRRIRELDHEMYREWLHR